MLIILYDPITGTPIPDGTIDSYVETIFKNYQNEKRLNEAYGVSVSTSLVIEAVRAKISTGDIPYDEVAFEYNGERITTDPDGRIENWPKGFCDHGMTYLETIFKGRE